MRGRRHSIRFRKVSNRYPLRVAEAYSGDLDRAMAASDEQVAAVVAAWERQHGLKPRSWAAIGERERFGDDDAATQAALESSAMSATRRSASSPWHGSISRRPSPATWNDTQWTPSSRMGSGSALTATRSSTPTRHRAARATRAGGISPTSARSPSSRAVSR